MNYIFDMDGTLIDSMPYFGKAILDFLKDNNITYPDDILKTVTPLGVKKTAEYFIDNLNCTLRVEEIVNDMGKRMIKDYTDVIPAKPFVCETVKRLKEEGHSINVLTASPHLTLDPCLKRLGLYDLFDNVWSSDDFNLSKSQVEIYFEAAKKLNADVSECIFIDDNYNAVATAKKSGMTVYGIYDLSSEEFKEDIIKVVDKYIYGFNEI